MAVAKYNVGESFLKVRGKEVWRDVKDFEGLYQVSDWGNVRSLDKSVWVLDRGTWYLRKCLGKLLRVSKKGRPTVSFHKGDEQHVRPVHHLVLEAFVSPKPIGLECCHNDGDFCNNRLENLRWDTALSNSADRVKHGTHVNLCGENHGQSVLTEAIVREARILRMSDRKKWTYRALGKHYGVAWPTIADAVNRKQWTWLD